jgi:hypothetical protein
VVIGKFLSSATALCAVVQYWQLAIINARR